MFTATTKRMEIPMSSWASFYRELANEANERAAEATTPSVKEKFEEVAKEWSELADWAERRNRAA
jgi:hypothetical protein